MRPSRIAAIGKFSLGTPYLFTSANPKHTLPSDVILRCTTFFQLILPLAASVMRPDSLPRLWHYVNLLLTYLLTYLVKVARTGLYENMLMTSIPDVKQR